MHTKNNRIPIIRSFNPLNASLEGSTLLLKATTHIIGYMARSTIINIVKSL